MDVAAVEGMSLPGIRLRNRPMHVMPSQKRVKARRKRRKELVLIQICVFGGLLLVVKGFSYLAENSGEHLAACSAPVRSAGMPVKESCIPQQLARLFHYSTCLPLCPFLTVNCHHCIPFGTK